MAPSKVSKMLIIVFALGLAIVGTSAQTPVTLNVWDVLPLAGREVFEELLEEFQSEYPHITIEPQRIPDGYHGIREKFVVSWASGMAPNVIQMGNAHTYDLRYQGVFAALDEYIAKDPTFDPEDWYPPFKEMVTLNQKTYGIPYNVSTPLLYYSPFVFETSGLEPTPPTTWDEMVTIGKRITRDESGDGLPDIWATDNVRSPGWVMEAFIAWNRYLRRKDRLVDPVDSKPPKLPRPRCGRRTADLRCTPSVRCSMLRADRWRCYLRSEYRN